ncbi:MAG TPA: hypothetical protein VI522_04055, partial [Gammaproteobacteria bacterium]|nr:hypothetical protein [Gammaproteobacteria bacterium]
QNLQVFRAKLEEIQPQAAQYLADNDLAFTSQVREHYYALQSYLHNLNKEYELERVALQKALDYSSDYTAICRYSQFLQNNFMRTAQQGAPASSGPSNQKLASIQQQIEHTLLAQTAIEAALLRINNHPDYPLKEFFLEKTKQLYINAIQLLTDIPYGQRTLYDYEMLYDFSIRQIAVLKRLIPNANNEYAQSLHFELGTALTLAIHQMQKDRCCHPDDYLARLINLNRQLFYYYVQSSTEFHSPFIKLHHYQQIASALKSLDVYALKLAIKPSDKIQQRLKQLQQMVNQTIQTAPSATAAYVLTTGPAKGLPSGSLPDKPVRDVPKRNYK